MAVRLLTLALLLCFGLARAAAGAEVRYPLGGGSALVLTVPDAWSEQRSTAGMPTITFRPRAGADFMVMVSPLRTARKTSLEDLRAEVEAAIDRAKDQAVETQIFPRRMTGPEVDGWAFSASDRESKPDEYKYLQQGVLTLAGLKLTFTILTNDGQDAVVASALAMLTGARREAAPLRAQGFSFDLPNPRLRISIPDAPPIAMGPHPLGPQQPQARHMGSREDGYTLSILLPTADPGMGREQCAISLVRSLAERYGLRRDQVVLNRLEEGSVALLFPLNLDGVTQLKAYFLSSDDAAHCVEVHLSKLGATEAEIADWLQSFDGTRVDRYLVDAR